MGLSSLSPRRRALVAGVVLALAAGGVPVLLVPGFDGSPASLGTLAARLRAGGRRVVVVALPRPPAPADCAGLRASGARVGG